MVNLISPAKVKSIPFADFFLSQVKQFRSQIHQPILVLESQVWDFQMSFLQQSRIVGSKYFMDRYKVVHLDNMPRFKAFALLSSKLWNIENPIICLRFECKNVLVNSRPDAAHYARRLTSAYDMCPSIRQDFRR